MPTKKRSKVDEFIATSTDPRFVSYRLRATAYHEAGHATAAFLLLGADAVREVSIKPDEAAETWGHVAHSALDFQPGDLELGSSAYFERLGRFAEYAVIAFAGNEAQKMWGGRYDWVGSDSDLEYLDHLAGAATRSETEAQAFTVWIMERTATLLRGRGAQAIFPAIAEALLKRETLTGEEIAAIARDAVLKAAIGQAT